MFAISQLFLVTCVAKGIDCPSGDGVAYLQTHKRRVGDPCLEEINTGVCQSAACTGCDGGATIPSNANRFPTGSLLCEDVACILGATSNPPYTFADANDFLECENAACVGFKVENVGALCCFGTSSCADSSISLASTGSCTKDVCCRDNSACDQSNLQGVKSLSCAEENENDIVCNNVNVDLAGDLYCKGLNACVPAVANFGPGEHCIRCMDDACSDLTGVFATSGSSNVFCSSAEGARSCVAASWSIPAGQSVRMYCEGQLTCEVMNVDLSGTLDLICNGTDACMGADINKQSGALCGCTALNGGVCPANCNDDVTVDPPSRCLNDQQQDFDEDTACCAGAGGCADCGCEAPTTSTTSTSTTTTTTTTSTSTASTTSTSSAKAPYRRHRRPRRPRRDNGRRPRYDAKQGTVSLWHWGMDKETKSAHDLQQQPVDFNIYAHGAGLDAFYTGLLLLDNSGANGARMALEMTSQDCRWHSKTNGAWDVVTDGTQLLSLPDSDGDVTAFKVVQSARKTHVQFLLKEVTAFTNLGDLFVRCKPGRFMKVKMSMQDVKSGMERGSFVQGTEDTGRRAEMMKTSQSWQELGGSVTAAAYLKLVDEQGTLSPESLQP